MDRIQAWTEQHPIAFQLAAVAALLLVCYLLTVLLRRWVVPGIERLTLRSRTQWDDVLHGAKVFARLAHVPPAFLAFHGVQAIPDLNPTVVIYAQRVAGAWMILAGTLALGAFLTAVNTIYSTRPENRERPIKGYLQVVKIVLYVAATVIIVAHLMDRSPWLFLSGLGAMTAVLLLIFKDTILSLVASIQLTSNEMVRVGDWIEMTQYGADGDVIDVALHTVKVQNWDKTITTIPTHKLISESFRNWRGMSDSGGRRIKRALHIDLNSIRFLDDEEIERFGQFALLRDYIAGKKEDLATHNRQPGIDPSLAADVRRLTNIGTLRTYIVQYLRQHPRIDQGMTLIVRQREPGPDGLPLEIYTFANDTAWESYEEIQSDLFDHIMAVVPEFGLRLFQSPSGSDIARLASHS